MKASIVACIVVMALSPPAESAAGATPAASAPSGAAAREGRWSELVPPDWNPRRQFALAGLGAVRDGSPEAMQMLEEMRAALNNAPTNPAIEGALLQLTGYVVPLDEVNGQLTEFLLVPYFGACIHVPPPPSNQIVHVIIDRPSKGIRSMDVVRVSGRLQSSRLDTDLGSSGYEMRGAAVDRP